MKAPIYKPENWVNFEQGETGGFGKIVGGSFDGEGWLYIIAGSIADGSHTVAREDEITYLFQNGSWLAPSGNGGQGDSAYKVE